MIRLNEVFLAPDEPETLLAERAARMLRVDPGQISQLALGAPGDRCPAGAGTVKLHRGCAVEAGRGSGSAHLRQS